MTAADANTKAALQGLLSGSRTQQLPCNLKLPSPAGEWCVQAHRQLRLLPAQRWVVAVQLMQAPEQQRPQTNADANVNTSQGLLKLFVGPKAMRHQARELAGAERLASSGVATPALLAQGQWPAVDGQDAGFLLYAWVNGVAVGDTPGNADFCRIVQTVATLHNQGLQQTDMHLGNFILAPDVVYAVDASDVQPLPEGKRRRAAALANLAVLFAQQQVAIAQVQLPNWVAAYQAATMDVVVQDEAGLVEQMRRLTHQQRHQRVRRYLQKSLRDCSEFHAQRSRGLRFLCVRSVFDDAFAAFARDPEAAMARGQVLKAGNTATVVRTHIGDRVVVIKRYNIKHWRHRLAQSLRGAGRALRAWHNALRLQFLGIPTAAPLALLETWRGPLRDTAYLVLADLGDNDLLHALQTPSAAQRWSAPVAELLHRLQHAGFVHGDTKATNFIIHNDILHIIDLDALQDVSNSGVGWQSHRGFGKDRARLLLNWQEQPEIRQLMESELQRLGMPT